MLALSAAIIAVCSCSVKEDIEPRLHVEQVQALAFNAVSGTIDYSIENPSRGISIDAVSDQEWIHDFDYSEDGRIGFAVEENLGGKRNANITISYGPAEPVIITVSQLTTAEAGNAKITIETKSPLEAGADGGELVIEYSIDVPVPGVSVRAEADQKWANHFEYPEYGRITVFPEANFYDTPRSAVITVSYQNAPDVTIEISQEASADTEDPFNIYVSDLTETEAVVSWFPSDKTMTYVNGITFRSSMDEYNGDYEKYVADEITYLKSQAESAGKTFGEYLQQVLVKGDLGVKWDRLDPDTEYCVYAFGLDYDGTVTSRFVMERFKTKGVSQLDCNFTFELDSSDDSRLSVKVIPDNPSVRYYPAIISKEDYESAGSDDVIIQRIVDYIDEEIWFQSLFGYWYTWADFTKIGTSVVSSADLFADTDYYAYAFGLEEKGLVTTNLQKQLFRTRPTEITDDCRFDISSAVSSSYMADFTITPSDDQTRYYVSVLETDFVLGYSLEEVATILINQANEASYDWLNGDYTYSGKQTLNSYYDLDIMPMEPSKNYTLVLFGVNGSGKRTTEVATEQFRTGTLVPSSMTFDIGVTDVTKDQVTLTCRPSLKEELYILGCMPLDKYNEFGSDEAAAAAVVEYWKNSYIYRVTYKGDMDLPANLDIFYNPIKGNTDYYVFAFGYMGAVTTPLAKVRFTTPEGDPVSGASVDITYTVRSGDDLVLEDPYKYPPDVWSDMAAIFFDITPNDKAAGWYFASFDNKLVELSTLPKEELIDNIRRYGNYNQSSAVVRMGWYETRVGAAVAEDADGVFGDPVLVEVSVGSPYSSSSVNFRRSVPEKVSLDKKDAPVTFAPVFYGYDDAIRKDFVTRFGHCPDLDDDATGRRIYMKDGYAE